MSVSLIQIAYFHKTIPSIDSADDCQNGILNDPVHLAVLSAYGSINLNLKKYKMENKAHVDVKFEWKTLAAALIWPLLSAKSLTRWKLGWWLTLSAMMSEILLALFASNKWYFVSCSDGLKLAHYVWEHLICGIFIFEVNFDFFIFYKRKSAL